jgi:salicylate hydroxylase
VSSRTIVIAGAGIGGLTAALALADRGFRIVLLEQAERLEEAGAGLQLSPNAARVLIALGLGRRLAAVAVPPEAIRIHTARGRELLRLPLGEAAETFYGAPYWMVHRGDLQSALLARAQAHPDITLELGAKVEEFAVHPNGITVEYTRRAVAADTLGLALIGADGLWSSIRARLGDRSAPRPAGRTAWRATLPTASVPPAWREPEVHLWLGRDCHLVHYPVRSGTAVNIVAIARDPWEGSGWSTHGTRDEVLAQFPQKSWGPAPRELLAVPERWLKWTLYDRPPLRQWGRGPVTLLGDAAHPMLPFLAQGAAMAIEDAAVLADALAKTPADPERGLRAYETERRPRTAQTQKAARRNGRTYHLGGPLALGRNLALKFLFGGDLLIRRYDWIYEWQPPPLRKSALPFG